MQFNSIQFLIFFSIVACLYFALPQRFRWMLVLGASYYFYGCWRMEYLALLIATTLIDYSVALWMEATEDRAKRRRILMLSLGSNIGVLVFFKYANFLSQTGHGLLTAIPELQILLPIGISFYTFQSISYAVQVYRRDLRAERHLGIFAAYVAFFPQLVAGPIERPTRLLPQFHERKEICWPRIQDGLKLMLWGFFKKIVIADRLAIYVNSVYNDVSGHDSVAIVLATYGFAFQVFCDFSGYTDIARGAAQVLGYELTLNFRQPYLAQSIGDFWSRWHISLSNWFRDYVYIPLGGNRVSRFNIYRNLFLTFLVSGLWHGANWTFLWWGALHGFYMCFGSATQNLRQRLVTALGLDRFPRALGLLRTFLTFHLVLLAWVLFRANQVGDALLIFRKVLALPAALVARPLLSTPFQSTPDLMFIALILLAASVHYVRREVKWFRDSLWTTAALALQFWFIVAYGVFDNKQFIYFQF